MVILLSILGIVLIIVVVDDKELHMSYVVWQSFIRTSYYVCLVQCVHGCRDEDFFII